MIVLASDDVEAARRGERAGLERVARAAEPVVFNLAIRMLANRADAEDATQEILIRIITHLGSVRDVGAAGAWAMRVACRHLVETRKRGRVEAMRLDFTAFADDLQTDFGASPHVELTEAEYGLALKEVKVGCTLAMLSCLSRALRIAYVLGDVFELSDADAARVLELSPATYRQRLKRARDQVAAFVTRTCGVVAEDAPCRCAGRVGPALAGGRIEKGASRFDIASGSATEHAALESHVRALDHAREKAAALMRSNPDFSSDISALLVQVTAFSGDGSDAAPHQ